MIFQLLFFFNDFRSSNFPSLEFLGTNIPFLIKFGRHFPSGEPFSNFLWFSKCFKISVNLFFIILGDRIYEIDSLKNKWALVGAPHTWFYDWLIDRLVVLIAIYDWFIMFYVMHMITLNLFTNLCFPWNKWVHHSGTSFAPLVHSVIFVLSDIHLVSIYG